jgi:hypothetical protein
VDSPPSGRLTVRFCKLGWPETFAKIRSWHSLGEFSLLGRLFPLGRFFQISEEATIFGYFCEKCCINFHKNFVVLGTFWTIL